MAGEILEWIKKGKEDFAKKWTTYVGIEVIWFVVSAILLIVAGIQAYSAMVQGMGGSTAYGLATLMVALAGTALVVLIVEAIASLVFATALLNVPVIEAPSIGEAFRRVPKTVLGVLATIIVGVLVFKVPKLLFAAIDAAIGTTFLVYIGKLIGLALVVKLATATARVVLGEGITEAIKNAWNTDFIKSLKLAVAVVLVALIGAVAAAVVAVIPIIGPIIALAIGLVVPGITVATYVKGTEEIR